MRNRLSYCLLVLALAGCGGSTVPTSVVTAKLTIRQPEAAQLCPAPPTGSAAFRLWLPLQVSESAGVAAEFRTLSATPFLGATGDGGAVLGTTGVVFGADKIEANQSLQGVARLPFGVDVGPGSPYTLRVALSHRDANGFNLEATLDDIEVVSVASCPE